MATIEQTIQLNKLLAEQTKILEAQSKLMKSNALSAKAMVDALKSGNSNSGDTSESFKQMNEAIKEAEESIKRIGQSDMSKLASSVENSTSMLGNMINTIKEIPDSALAGTGAVIGAFRGFRASLKLSTSIVKTTVSGIATLGQTFFNLGTSILSVPFKALNALMDEAANISGTEFRQAIEDTRKQFGELATNEGKAVIDSFRSMRGDLAETGLSVRRVLGNFAERLRHLKELAENLGPAFSVLKDSIVENAEAAVAYQKGLGLTEEGMQGVADRAIAMGTTFQEQGRQITTMAYQMGESFGINGKLISRDVGSMMKDIQNFGGLSVKTMTQVATYTRKLGIEMKDLQGVIGKFDDFEDAAKAAAQLNQAFGIQIDTIGMLKDQDPASRFDKLRKAFLATGKSVDQLSRQERNLLAQQTGLSDKAIQLGFANRNLGYDEVQKEAEKAEDNQLTQAQAMDKLAMSIERMVKSGEGHRGFWDTFLKGIARGIRWSEPFRKMMIGLKRALNSTFHAGIMGGRAIVKLWPGLSDVFSGMTGFFKELGSFTGKGKATGFFKEFADGMKLVMSGEKSLNSFFNEMKDKLWKIFTGENAKKVANSFKKVFMALGKAAGEGFKFLIPKMTEGVKILTNLITNPEETLASLKKGGGGFIGGIIDVLKPSFKAIMKAAPALIDALKELMFVAWEKVKPYLYEAAMKIFDTYKTTAFWFTITRGIWGALGGALSKGAVNAAGKLAGGLAGKMGGKGGFLGVVVSKVIGDPKELQAASNVAKATKAASEGVGKASEGIKPSSFKDFAKSLGKAALGFAAIAVAVTAMAGHAHLLVSITSGLNMEEVIKSKDVVVQMLMAYTAAAIGLVESAGIGYLMGLSGGTMAAAMLAGIGAIGTIATAMAGHASLLIIQTSNIDEGLLKKANNTISAMLSVYSSAALAIGEAALIGATAFTGIGGAAMWVGFKIIDSVVDSMAKTAGPIIEKLGKIPFKAGLEKKVSALTSIMSSLTDLTKAVTSIMSKAGGGIFEQVVNVFKGGSLAAQMQKAMHSMTMILGVLKDTALEVIDGVVDLASGMPDADAEKIKIIGSIITTITGLAKAITPPSDSGFGGAVESLIDPNKLDKMATHMSSVLDIVKNNVAGMLDAFIVAAEKIKQKKIESKDINIISTIMKNVGELFNALKPSPEMIEALDTNILDKLMGKGDITEKLYGPGGAMTKMIESFTKQGGILDKAAAFANSLTGKIQNPEVVKEASATLSNVIKSMGSINDIKKDLPDEKFINMDNVFNSLYTDVFDPVINNASTLQEGFVALQQAMGEDGSVVLRKVGNIVKGMVKEANMITENLANIQPIKIDSAIRKIGDKIGDKQNFTIKRKDLVVNVNLNVTMDADELKSVLKNKGVVVREQSKQ